MSVIEQNPRCRLCGNAMSMTRFQSTVTATGIDREHLYECLWCGETDKAVSHIAHKTKDDAAVSSAA